MPFSRHGVGPEEKLGDVETTFTIIMKVPSAFDMRKLHTPIEWFGDFRPKGVFRMATGPKEREDLQTTVAEAVLAQVRSALPEAMVDKLSLDTPLLELGLDSLKVMEVLNRVEEMFGMRFREEWLYDMQTCRDVVVCVEANMTQGSPAAKSFIPVLLRPIRRPNQRNDPFRSLRRCAFQMRDVPQATGRR